MPIRSSRTRNNSNADCRDRIKTWKKNVPYLYDTIYQESLDCPSYATAFGDLIETDKYNNIYRLINSRATKAHYSKDKHNWAGDPHCIILYNAYIPKKLTTQTKKLTKTLLYQTKTKFNKIVETKRIIHPGPVLRIKPKFSYNNNGNNNNNNYNSSSEVIATHTQHKYVFVWNITTQANRGTTIKPDSDPNTPELILKGHKKEALHGLDFSRQSWHVISGSKDGRICLWNITDYETTLSETRSKYDGKNFKYYTPLSHPSPKLKPCSTLKGHTKDVNDISFDPNNYNIVASVSSDASLKIWDTRAKNGSGNANVNNSDGDNGNFCVSSFNNLHSGEATRLAWNRINNNYIVTSGNERVVKLIDMRKMGKVLREFSGHRSKITSLEWNPNNENYFLSGSHDGTVLLWNCNLSQQNSLSNMSNDNSNSSNDNSNANSKMDSYEMNRTAVHFKHIGHMNEMQGSERIHSVSWLNCSPNDNCDWTICSVSSPSSFIPSFWSDTGDKDKDKDKDNSKGNNNNNSTNGNDKDDEKSASDGKFGVKPSDGLNTSFFGGNNSNLNEDVTVNDKEMSQSGILQVWRPNSLLTMSKEEIIAFLRKRENETLTDDSPNYWKKKGFLRIVESTSSSDEDEEDEDDTDENQDNNTNTTDTNIKDKTKDKQSNDNESSVGKSTKNDKDNTNLNVKTVQDKEKEKGKEKQKEKEKEKEKDKEKQVESDDIQSQDNDIDMNSNGNKNDNSNSNSGNSSSKNKATQNENVTKEKDKHSTPEPGASGSANKNTSGNSNGKESDVNMENKDGKTTIISMPMPMAAQSGNKVNNKDKENKNENENMVDETKNKKLTVNNEIKAKTNDTVKESSKEKSKESSGDNDKNKAGQTKNVDKNVVEEEQDIDVEMNANKDGN